MNIFINNNKSPNDLHDYLINSNCFPLSLSHNALYNQDGEKIEEAKEIYIEIEEEKEEELTDLVNQFMAQ